MRGPVKPRPCRIGSASERVPQAGDIVAWPVPQQQADGGRAIGKAGGDALQSNLGGLIDRKRQHMRWQSVAGLRQRLKHGGAVRLIMEKNHRLRATRGTIGQQHRAELSQQRIRRRQRVGCSPCRTGGRALPATGADVRIDRHVIARWGDGARRTEIKATPAADDVRARMRAQGSIEGNVPGFFEGAREIARSEHRFQHGGPVARIATQIAVTKIVCGK
jgi:hypothetical protein